MRTDEQLPLAPAAEQPTFAAYQQFPKTAAREEGDLPTQQVLENFQQQMKEKYCDLNPTYCQTNKSGIRENVKHNIDKEHDVTCDGCRHYVKRAEDMIGDMNSDMCNTGYTDMKNRGKDFFSSSYSKSEQKKKVCRLIFDQLRANKNSRENLTEQDVVELRKLYQAEYPPTVFGGDKHKQWSKQVCIDMGFCGSWMMGIEGIVHFKNERAQAIQDKVAADPSLERDVCDDKQELQCGGARSYTFSPQMKGTKNGFGYCGPAIVHDRAEQVCLGTELTDKIRKSVDKITMLVGKQTLTRWDWVKVANAGFKMAKPMFLLRKRLGTIAEELKGTFKPLLQKFSESVSILDENRRGCDLKGAVTYVISELANGKPVRFIDTMKSYCRLNRNDPLVSVSEQTGKKIQEGSIEEDDDEPGDGSDESERDISGDDIKNDLNREVLIEGGGKTPRTVTYLDGQGRSSAFRFQERETRALALKQKAGEHMETLGAAYGVIMVVCMMATLFGGAFDVFMLCIFWPLFILKA
eukprot:g5695.t1